MNRGVDCRHGSDLALLWLWYRLAATILIRLLAWEPPYAASVALNSQRRKEKGSGSDQLRKPIAVQTSQPLCFSHGPWAVFWVTLGTLPTSRLLA